VVVRAFVPAVSSDLGKSVVSERLSETSELALEVAGHDVVREVWAVVDHESLAVRCP